MQGQLRVYNTLTRQKERFIPLSPGYVGMYVCGPTVYGHPHLGHARGAIVFDVVCRYLKYLGYRVRYVRNITDVGHLEQDADTGEDKVEKQARLEALEPMEVAQRYINSYSRAMSMLNVQAPSIEPRASGHIPEQIAMIQQIIEAGLAYASHGSVYFDVRAYNKIRDYGRLSGRTIENMLTGTRSLDGQQGKRDPLDFALWKQATSAHSMRWPSPWGEGFPGWHIECSAIASRYLGPLFDIHGGGLDLLFPHHECELAQSQAASHTSLARYWLHNNLITIDGQKMGKSLGNAMSLEQLFRGNHALLSQAYSPMTLRFFVLQAHYRSTLSFSDEALRAAQGGYFRLMNGLKVLNEFSSRERESNYVAEDVDPVAVIQVQQHCAKCHEAMNDDFNTAQVIAALFKLLKIMNTLQNKPQSLSALGPDTFGQLRDTYVTFVKDILGICQEPITSIAALLDILISLYNEAKVQKQYDRVDSLRTQLKTLGIAFRDTPAGVQWSYVERE